MAFSTPISFVATCFVLIADGGYLSAQHCNSYQTELDIKLARKTLSHPFLEWQNSCLNVDDGSVTSVFLARKLVDSSN